MSTRESEDGDRRSMGLVTDHAVSEVTCYVALPFVATDDGIATGEAVECFNSNLAVMRAEAFSRKPGYVGTLAFRRTGDPATGG